jgi:ribosomal protein S18 acetylase RimI-like enzyme
VTLRSLRASDVGSLATWLPAAAASVGCERWPDEASLRAAAGRSDVLLFRDRAGEAFIAYDIDAPVPGAVRIELLAVAPDRRRLGLGSRAALALEKRIGRSAERIYVAVPATTGLALYFWLRLGYRPLLQREWPAPLDGVSAWMMRDLRQPSSSLRYSRSARPK